MIGYIFFGVGIALVALIVSFFGITEIISTIMSSNLLFVLLAGLCFVATICLYAIRLKFISKKYGSISFLHALKIAFVGLFINAVTPIAKAGGEPVKIYMLKEGYKEDGGSKASAVICIDLFVEMLSCYITFAVILIYILFTTVLPPILLYAFIVFLVVFFVLMVVALKLFLSKHMLSNVVDWLTNKLSFIKKIHKKKFTILPFQECFRDLLTDKKRMTKVLVVSFLTKVFEVARVWFVFLALSTVVPIDTILILWCVLLVIGLLPLFPGGLGIIELGGTSAFILLGVTQSIAAGGMLLDRFITFWLVILLGIIYISRSGLKDVIKEHIRGKS